MKDPLGKIDDYATSITIGYLGAMTFITFKSIDHESGTDETLNKAMKTLNSDEGANKSINQSIGYELMSFFYMGYEPGNEDSLHYLESLQSIPKTKALTDARLEVVKGDLAV